jgi:hypothetical protein
VDEIRESLIEEFKAILNSCGRPDWAHSKANGTVDLTPSVPFIGRNYIPGKGLLVYASAENVKGLTSENCLQSLYTKNGFDRYRFWYNESEGGVLKEFNYGFFPRVGIGPVDSGGLLTAAHLIASRLKLPAADNPREFLESISIGNWCKFVRSDNADYIRDFEKLTRSIPYIKAELGQLQPRVVVLPSSILNFETIRNEMQIASERASFIPVRQCIPRSVYVHMKGQAGRALAMREHPQNHTLANWVQKWRGWNKERAWWYLAHVEEELLKIPKDEVSGI